MPYTPPADTPPPVPRLTLPLTTKGLSACQTPSPADGPVASTWPAPKIEGLHRVTLKSLRHTHATLLLELGEHPKVVQERLGHSTITTTMNIYSHVTPTMQSAIDRFAAHLGGDVAGA
ncbi:MAG: tyrosine-type recombinase/integrase [Nocardioides sp.]